MLLKTILPIMILAVAFLPLPVRLPAQRPAGALRASDELAILRDVQTGFSNAGWKYDRYTELPSLDAGTRMIVADVKGPGIIRHIHTTRHHPADVMARGIVLEIYFDDAPQPAVRCPLADFFGDGCNGKSMFFSTPLIECAPWSYNCYIPMPFRQRAVVVLVNDTDKNAMNYSYVEWEPLEQWNDQLGYFHATWRRHLFQLTKDSNVEFFRVKGAGHILGRQFSVATNEPLFGKFHTVMEGNNEIDIDGHQRALDYLGTEDSFTFSWGFQNTFAGLRAGMPYIAPPPSTALSIYRFHDHQPIRFQRELVWRINWQEERSFTKSPQWADRVQAQGCWLHYDTVFYWYQDQPASYAHAPLPDPAQRQLSLAKTSVSPLDLQPAIQTLRVDSALTNTFDVKEDLQRVAILGCYPDTHPFWIDTPEAKGGHPGNPNPGRRGILAVHPQGPLQPATVLWRVRVPDQGRYVLRITTSGDPYEAPGQSDFVLRAGIQDGEQLHWYDPQIVDAGSSPDAGNWRVLEYPVERFAGHTITVVIQVAYGGQVRAMNEEAFFDQISLCPAQ